MDTDTQDEIDTLLSETNNGESIPSHIVPREKRLRGWIGIQRYSNPDDYGIDFIRNGRKILMSDKSLFYYENPWTGTKEIQYPVELGSTVGGRIVGELHVDFLLPTYQKNDFDRTDYSWRQTIEYRFSCGGAGVSTFLTEDITSGRNWRGLERAVARIMLHLGWHDVTVIGGTGDQGGDVLGTKYDTNSGQERAWVVQCKAVTGSNYVGKGAVDEAIHALSQYDASTAAVATNGEFTASAVKRKDNLCAGGFDTRLWNGFFLSELADRMPDKPVRQRSLRPYQQTIVDKVMTKYNKGDKRAFYIVATGLGKTVIAASIAMQLWEAGCHRILVLCHATDLALQLEQGFWPQIVKQIPTSVFYGGLPPRNTEGICFGLYQSLLGYLPGIEPDRFDAIIIDEAHHAMAQGFRRCIDTLKPRFLIGMTATPWRGDGKQLTEMFGEPVEKVSLVDGMAMGYLSKVDYRIFCDILHFCKTAGGGFSFLPKPPDFRAAGHFLRILR